MQRGEVRVRDDQFPLLDGADVVASMVVGGLAILLTIPVVTGVARRNRWSALRTRWRRCYH